ncbi:MAG: hypothetical protein AAGA36_15075 [Pseudomonadota bacterium]
MKKYLDAARSDLRKRHKNIFFFGAGDGARLVTSQGPWKDLSKSAAKAIIFVQPFAEEMNRCRRLISLCQQALSDQSICSLTLDYFGTGDSAGEFEDARLQTWIEDINTACDLARHSGAQELCLVGIRFGGLLAQLVANSRSDVTSIYCVQPQQDLSRAMRQFLRIAFASLDPADGDGPVAPLPSPSKQLAAGATVCVGGYKMTPHLFSDFDETKLPSRIECCVTSIFVGLSARYQDSAATKTSLSSADQRIFEDIEGRAQFARSMLINDVQIWHQGVPEEPRALPQAIAEEIAGDASNQAHRNLAESYAENS